MSRFSRSESPESQIDPFSAGEPVLPWDDPSAEHDECRFDDGAGYDAPSPDRTAERRERTRRRASENGRDARRQRQQPRQRRSPAQADARGGADAGEDRPDEDPATARQRRATKWRRGCITLFLALVALEVLASILSCTSEVFSSAVDALFGSETVSVQVDDGSDDSDEDAAEAELLGTVEAQDLVEARLSALAEDETARELVAEDFRELVEDFTGRTPDSLGLDASAFAAWYLDQFWYEIDDVYCWDDGTGVAYFYCLGFDPETGWDFAQELADYLSDEGVYDDQSQLSDEQLAHIQELYEEFLDEIDTDESTFEYLELVEADGAWAIDEDFYAEELEWILYIY